VALRHRISPVLPFRKLDPLDLFKKNLTQTPKKLIPLRKIIYAIFGPKGLSRVECANFLLPTLLNQHKSLPLHFAFSAQSASFTRKIFALWRMSTGNSGWNRNSLIAWVVPFFDPISFSSSRMRECSVFDTPFSNSTQRTGVCSPGRPTPTSAERKTFSWKLNMASQGIVKSVRSLVTTRCDFLGLTGDRKKRPILGNNPVRFSSAEPNPSFFVQVAQIPHAMPESPGKIRDFG